MKYNAVQSRASKCNSMQCGHSGGRRQMRDNVKGADMWPGPGFNVRLSFNIMPCSALRCGMNVSLSFTDWSVTSPPILCQLKVAITCLPYSPVPIHVDGPAKLSPNLEVQPRVGR